MSENAYRKYRKSCPCYSPVTAVCPFAGLLIIPVDMSAVFGIGTGSGVCMKGDYNGPSECTTWSYLSCPTEDECSNGHHLCDESREKCVDQIIGRRMNLSSICETPTHRYP